MYFYAIFIVFYYELLIYIFLCLFYFNSPNLLNISQVHKYRKSTAVIAFLGLKIVLFWLQLQFVHDMKSIHQIWFPLSQFHSVINVKGGFFIISFFWWRKSIFLAYLPKFNSNMEQFSFVIRWISSYFCPVISLLRLEEDLRKRFELKNVSICSFTFSRFRRRNLNKTDFIKT